MAKRIDSLRRAVAETLELRQMLASIASASPLNGAQHIGIASDVTVTFNEAMNASTFTTGTLQLRDPAGGIVPTAITYVPATRTVTLHPTSPLTTANGYYSVTVAGGASGVKDSGGGVLTKDYAFSFTTGAPQFSEKTIFSGLIAPTSIQFSPDGRVFVAEKRGVIKVYDSLTDTTPDIFADLRTEVHNYWDRGLLGITLDPNFTNGRPYVYAVYTYDGDIGGTSPKWGQPNTDSDTGGPSPTGTGATVSGRLVKLTASGNVMTNEQVLINDWVQQFPSHSIGDITFGPDGYLYASGGDGASFNYADFGQTGNPFNDPTNEGGALRTQDLLSPNDPTNLNGTVIRIDPDTGLGAPGNPLTGDTNRQRIIASGLRNPFRLAFRPGTSELWVDDTGWNSFEEINRIADVNAGALPNFGWPAFEGPDVQSGYQSLNLPLLQQLYANPSLVTAPYFSYRHDSQVAAGSNEPIGASSSTGLAFYTTGNYPTAYNGALFFADYSRASVYVMYVGPNGLPDPTTRQLFPTTTAGAVCLRVGPNGNLFYVDMNYGRVVELSLVPNHTPLAVITSDKSLGATPLTVSFNAGNSTDPDAGDLLSYAWDLDGDGNFNDSTAIAPTFVYTTPGTYTVQLRVTDGAGLYSISSLQIVAGNTAPTPVISTPAIPTKWQVGDTITFGGSATDLEDGILGTAALSWKAVLVYGSLGDPNARQDRPIQQFNGVAGGSFTAPEWDYPAWLEIRLTATDSGGASSTTILRLDPQVAKLSLASNVPGMSITLDGNAYTTPNNKTVIVNSTNTIAAPATATVNGVTYNFASWSDSGAISHTFSAPNVDTVYTAIYTTAAVAAPSPLTVTATPDGREAILHWTNNATSAATFVFDRSTSPTFDTIDVTRPAAADTDSYWDWGLTSGVQYYYRIRAIVNGVSSNNSNTATITLGTPLPAAPTNLVVGTNSGGTPTQALLTWVDASSNETGFTIQRSTSNTFATIDATLNAAANSVQLIDSGLVFGTTYYYRIRSDNGAVSSAWVPAAAYTPVNPTPALPTNLVAGANPGGLNTQSLLTWTDASNNETGFTIQRSTSSTFATIDATLSAAANTTQIVDSGLTLGTTYYYRVRADNGVYASAFTAAVTYSPAIPVPALPTNLAVGANPGGLNTQSLVTWTDASNNETGFTIQRSTSSSFATIDATLNAAANSVQVIDSGLTLGTTYYYRVRADNGVYASAFTTAATYTPAVPVPALPTNLTVGANPGGLNTQSLVTWTDASNNETGFTIQRSTSSTFATIGATLTAAANAVQVVDSGLTLGVTYYYRVRADNGATSSAWTAAVAYTPVNPVPAAPTNLAVGANPGGAATQAKIVWIDNSNNETGFTIQRSTSSTFATISATLTAGANAVQLIDSGLTVGTTYYYRIRSDNGVNASAWTAGVSYTPVAASPVPAVPTNLKVAVYPGANSTQAGITWTDNSNNETGFIIQRSTSSTFATIDATRTAATNNTLYVDWGLTIGTTYYYRLAAVNGASQSAWTATFSYKPTSAPVAPATPTGLTVKPATGTNTQLVLNWNDTTGLADYYVIERSTTAAFTTFTTVAQSAYHTYYDWGLKSNTTYYYRIKGVNATGSSAYSTIVGGKTSV